MGIFFQHTRGSVKMVDGPWRGAPSLVVKAQDMEINQNKAIITQVAISMNGNFQFVHCINDQIFVYVFGDRISELTISGVAFSQACTDKRTGIDDVLRGYQRKKLSRTGRPVIVAIGSFRFQSFLTGMSLDITDAELQLAQFSYRFHTIPQG